VRIIGGIVLDVDVPDVGFWVIVLCAGLASVFLGDREGGTGGSDEGVDE
jgi:hypothetical protein